MKIHASPLIVSTNNSEQSTFELYFIIYRHAIILRYEISPRHESVDLGTLCEKNITH